MTNDLTTLVTSKTRTVEIQRDKPTVIIGERINPTGRNALLKDLKKGNDEFGMNWIKSYRVRSKESSGTS